MMPYISNSFSCWLMTRELASGNKRWISLGRIEGTSSSSKMLHGLPATFDPSRILLVGLRNWERDEIKVRQQAYGLRHLAPHDVAHDSEAVKQWLRSCGASKVVIHFDMDVLDPNEIVAAVGTDPEGMKIAEVVRLINDIAHEKELVGLTIAEPMPRTAIRIRSMLRQLPLF